MKKLTVLAWLCGVGIAVVAMAAELPRRTALDDYLAATDLSYSWRVLSVTKADDGTATIIVDLTSQRWLTERRGRSHRVAALAGAIHTV